MNQRDFSSASPSFRLRHQPATLLQKQRATESGREKIKAMHSGLDRLVSGSWQVSMVVVWAELLRHGYGSSCEVTWTSWLSQLPVQLILLSIWLWVTVASNTRMHARIHTHLYRLCSHLSPNTHMLTLLIITSLALKHTFHTLVLTAERVVGLMPNALHFPLCSDIYLHRWRCHCCWRLFCTGPERELCEGDGRSADPTETPAKDHNILFHWYQLKLLQTELHVN